MDRMENIRSDAALQCLQSQECTRMLVCYYSPQNVEDIDILGLTCHY